MNLYRITALVLRYTFLYTRSFPRVLEMFFWPVMDLLVWGMLTQYLQSAPYQVPGFIRFLLGSMILWTCFTGPSKQQPFLFLKIFGLET